MVKKIAAIAVLVVCVVFIFEYIAQAMHRYPAQRVAPYAKQY